MAPAADRPRRVAVAALGERRYWGLLRVADAMLGNSSSGLDRGARRPAPGRQRRRPAGRPAPVRATSSTCRPIPTRSPSRSRRALDPAFRRRAPGSRARHGGRPGRRAGRAYHRGMATIETPAQAADPRAA